MFILEVEEVVREIMEDPCFKGHQHYRFEMEVDADNRERFFEGGSAGVGSQIGQLRYIPWTYHM